MCSGENDGMIGGERERFILILKAAAKESCKSPTACFVVMAGLCARRLKALLLITLAVCLFAYIAVASWISVEHLAAEESASNEDMAKVTRVTRAANPADGVQRASVDNSTSASTIAPDDPNQQSVRPTTKPSPTNDTTIVLRRVRVLIGIFATRNDEEYRERFRSLFDLHPLVCSLGRYKRMHEMETPCQLVYAFVMGGNPAGKAPTMLLDESLPILVAGQDGGSDDDKVFLNIRENMNQGKSQTWFYYASCIMDKLSFDYIDKADTDTMLHLDKFLSNATMRRTDPRRSVCTKV